MYTGDNMSNNSRGSNAVNSHVVPEAEYRSPPRRESNWPTCVALGAIVILNVVVVAKIHLPLIRPVLGFWFILICPAYLLYTTSAWRRCGVGERLGYSFCTALLVLIAVGLGINTVLPFMGVERPLDIDAVLVAGNLINASLYALRSRYPERVRLRDHFSAIGREEFRLLVLASLSLVLVVLGSNRLNNGAGAQLTLIALSAVTLTILLHLRWTRLVREGITYLVIYLVSLSLLLSTSLRGWYVTGHDIQEEYRVFQLTEAHGRWDIAYFHNAYNACLSITILPTEIGEIVNVDSPYVYKLFFQMIFALCPVLVYVISRRYWKQSIAILAVTYFIGFPTFFTDMPFLNRQEIAFLFVCIGVLAATNAVWSFRRRQVALIVAGIGVELAHYSTMYIFLGTLVIAWLSRYGATLLARCRHTRMDPRALRIRWAAGVGRTVTIGSIVVLVGIVFLWGDLATNTSGQILATGESAISGLGGHSSNARSENVSFSLLGGGAVQPSAVLENYRQITVERRTGVPSGIYLPTSEVSKVRTPIVQQQLRPLTTIGRALTDIGAPVVSINSLMRNVTAYCEQLFLAIGLSGLLIVRRRQRRRIGQESFWLCIGSVCMVALITVLPAISTDYGVLRAFQESLMVLGPVVVVGSITIFRFLGERRAQIAATMACLGLFVTTTNLLPQLLGGNLAELNLNNSGNYYDMYYMRPQDEAAVSWLGGQPGVLSDSIQASYMETKFMFTNLAEVNGVEAITDIYPTTILRNSWLILGYPTVGTGLAWTSYDGDLIEYRFPSHLLGNNKNLVYDNGGAEIYK